MSELVENPQLAAASDAIAQLAAETPMTDPVKETDPNAIPAGEEETTTEETTNVEESNTEETAGESQVEVQEEVKEEEVDFTNQFVEEMIQEPIQEQFKDSEGRLDTNKLIKSYNELRKHRDSREKAMSVEEAAEVFKSHNYELHDEKLDKRTADFINKYQIGSGQLKDILEYVDYISDAPDRPKGNAYFDADSEETKTTLRGEWGDKYASNIKRIGNYLGKNQGLTKVLPKHPEVYKMLHNLLQNSTTNIGDVTPVAKSSPKTTASDIFNKIHSGNVSEAEEAKLWTSWAQLVNEEK